MPVHPQLSQLLIVTVLKTKYLSSPLLVVLMALSVSSCLLPRFEFAPSEIGIKKVRLVNDALASRYGQSLRSLAVQQRNDGFWQLTLAISHIQVSEEILGTADALLVAERLLNLRLEMRVEPIATEKSHFCPSFPFSFTGNLVYPASETVPLGNLASKNAYIELLLEQAFDDLRHRAALHLSEKCSLKSAQSNNS